MAAKARLRLDGADPINKGLVGFWPLTESGGARALDISPYCNYGASENTPGRTGTRQGLAYSFAGGGSTAQNVNLGTAAAYNTLQVPFTFSARVLCTSTGSLGQVTILGQYSSFVIGNLIKYLDFQGGTLRYLMSQNGAVTQTFSGPAVTTNVEYHVAVVVSGTISSPSLRLYVNNTFTDHTPAALNGSVSTTVPVRIGTTTDGINGNFDVGWRGWISGVRMWNRALSRTEIQRLYREPWAGTARPRRRVLATTGTPHTATPGAGAETYAGQGATVKAGATLLPGAGAETYAGKQAAVTAGVAVAVGAGTETYQGLGAGVTQPATVAVGAGLVEVLGLQAALGSGLSGRVVRRGRYRTWDDVPTELAPVVSLAENYADELAVQRAVDDALARFAAMKAKTSIARRERLVGDLKRAIVAAVEEAAEADDEDALIALL